MSVHAGSILHVAGQNVIDRIQNAGLGDVRLPMETIREVGNREVVDKVPGDPDFTFDLETLDVSVEVMATLVGQFPGSVASASAAGSADPDGTEYDWLNCGFINIVSPWKDPKTASAGTINAGVIIPAYYPTQIQYRFGATDNATETVTLGGGSYFYAENACPVEERRFGNGVTTAFATADPAIRYRKGGAGGTTFNAVFGVLVDGVLQVEGVDFTQSGGAANPGSTATITFTTAPAAGKEIQFCYFTSAAKSFPQTVHASTVTKPAAVRGRNIKVYIDAHDGNGLKRISGIQTLELTATVDGEAERELGSEDIVGRTVNGTDANGTLTIRSKDKDAFFDTMNKVTGVARTEVFGWFNLNDVDFQARIENPKNPGQIIKTLRVRDCKFQPPGTPARVNSPTDFAFQFESKNGSFVEVKGTPTS